MGNFVEVGKKINCYSFFYCSTCFCELILEALSRGPVDSRHFVLPTFCAVWREKLPTAELCTTSTSNWDHLTAHTEFGPRLKKWIGPGFRTGTEVFSAKKMSEVLPSHRRLCPHWPGLWEPPGGADDPTKSYCCRHYLPAPHIPHGAFHLHLSIFAPKSPIWATTSKARTEGLLFVFNAVFITTYVVYLYLMKLSFVLTCLRDCLWKILSMSTRIS